MQSTREEEGMKYSKCRCIKAVCAPRPDEMCVTNVLTGPRLMRWYALRDTAGRTERLYRSSCCTLLLTDPLARRKIPRHMDGRLGEQKRLEGNEQEDRCEGTIGKLLKRRIRFASKREKINISSRNKRKNISDIFLFSLEKYYLAFRSGEINYR